MGSGRCVVFLAGRDGEKVLLPARFSGSPVTGSLDTTVLMKAVAPLCGGDGGGTTMVAQGGGWLIRICFPELPANTSAASREVPDFRLNHTRNPGPGSRIGPAGAIVWLG